MGYGTPAARWRSSPQWQAMTEVSAAELVPAGFRLVVIAPHPDDEVLGAGGLLQLAAQLGREVLVVAVTDGGGSHPGSELWPAARLLEQRRAESSHALALLGLDGEVVHRLGLPDGQVEAEQDRLAASLQTLLRPADVVVAPWQLDGHPDHEVVGRHGASAASAIGARFVQMPIWGWHWAHPDHPAFPWRQAVRLSLDGVGEQKRLAVQCFESQLAPDPSTGAGPILPDWALARLVGDCEVFLR